MGVDLRLLPFCDDDDDADFSIDVISLGRNYELFGAISKIEAEDAPKWFKSFNGTTRSGSVRYGITVNDAYGQRLKFVFASSLKSLSNHDGVLDNERNRRAWAYINACPDNLKIALYWY